MRARVTSLIRPALVLLVLALLAAAVIPWTPLRQSILDLGEGTSTPASEASVRLDLQQCMVVAQAKGYDITYLERVLAGLDRAEQPPGEDLRLALLGWLLDACRQITE